MPPVKVQRFFIIMCIIHRKEAVMRNYRVTLAKSVGKKDWRIVIDSGKKFSIPLVRSHSEREQIFTNSELKGRRNCRRLSIPVYSSL